MHTVLKDAQYALRVLARSRGFTAAAIVCLALGIGATAAIFSVVNAVLMRPLPYYEPERLTRIYSEFPTFPGGGLRKFWISGPELLELKRETRSWETIEEWIVGGANLSGSTEPIRVTAAYVSAGLLRTLGVSPVTGRVHAQQDDVPGAPLSVVISQGLWTRAFGADRRIVGRPVQVDGQGATIVGVMPAAFQFPPGEPDPAEIWVPLQLDPARPGGRGGHSYSLIARLKSGVTIEQSRQELAELVRQHAKNAAPRYHDFHPVNHTLITAGLQDEVVGAIRPAMLMLMGAVVFVLLISCVNVANLLLARAEGRRREIAVRKAVGASVGRLLGQFVTEGVILSLAGALVGTALAFLGLRAIIHSSLTSIPRAGEIGIDWRVLAVTVVLSIATGVFFGLAPMAQVAIPNLHEALKTAVGRTTAGVSSHRFRKALVVVELALALILLVGSGLMVRAFWKLQQVNVGLNPHGVLSLRVAIPSSIYANAGSTVAFWTRLQQKLDEMHGAASAAVIRGLPPVRRINANDTQIEGWVPVPGGPIQNVDYWNVAGSKYFETMQIPLIEGRLLDERDGPGAPLTVVVNQTMARTFWPGRSAIGRRIKPGNDWRTIVGVVADVKNSGIEKPTGTELYIPLRQLSDQETSINTAYIVARTSGDPMSLAEPIRRAVQSIDSAVPVSLVRPMDDVIGEAQSRPRFLATLLTIFSTAALLLAAVGIYGVISYAVAERTAEFGIRMAMGASQSDVLRMVLGSGMRLGFTGVAIGAVVAIVVARSMKGLLFGIEALDPATFLFMAVALVAVSILACWIPARRATRVDPMVALRYE